MKDRCFMEWVSSKPAKTQQDKAISQILNITCDVVVKDEVYLVTTSSTQIFCMAIELKIIEYVHYFPTSMTIIWWSLESNYLLISTYIEWKL